MSASTPTSRRDAWSALLAGFLGWTMDAFDFFLVVYCLTAIGKDFGQTDRAVSFSLFLTLAFRPLGALLFGMLADRYGRRLPLMLDLLFYSVVEVLTGFAQNFTTFLVLRALFGVGMGGEWGVGASLVMEKVSPRWRGLLSGLLQQGYALGNVLAALCFFFLFERWGWRPLFFLGGLPALLALFVRLGVRESAVWEKTKSESWAGLLRSLSQHWKLFLFLVLLMAGMNFCSHGTQDMYPTFLQRYWHKGVRERAFISGLSMTGAIVGGVVVGWLSDHIGRRYAIALSLLGAMLVVPLWAFSPGAVLLILGAWLIQFFVQGAWGVIPAHLSELSPNAVRGVLPGFSYQCGVLIASVIPAFQASLAEHMPYARAMALSAVVVFGFTAGTALLSRERRAIDFEAAS